MSADPQPIRPKATAPPANQATSQDPSPVPTPGLAPSADSLAELLRKEADHRIGNSLHLLSGLLNVQQLHIMDHHARDALARTSKRLRLVAQLHQRLSIGDGQGFVALEEYLAGLRDEIFAAVVDHHRHALLVNVDPVRVPVRIASAAGMIINEFIFNSLKHAYPGQDQGTIEIACGKGQDGALYLTVSDDGVGLPQDMEPETASGLGLKLMRGLVAQLCGRFEIHRRERGTSYEIMFPLPA